MFETKENPELAALNTLKFQLLKLNKETTSA
jgi:hypothetical protein